MDPRQERGLMIAALCRITRGDGHWLVPSQSGKGHYKVHFDPPGPAVCTCPDFEERGQPCKHVFAVQYVVQRETNPDGSVTLTETITVTGQTTAPRPTYRQQWSAYNRAQTTEKARFQVLLHDLCKDIEDLPSKDRGRPRNRLSDMIFAAAFKVYSTFSGRRFQTDLNEAHAKGYLAKAPHYNTVFSYMENPELIPILRGLIIESSLPLKAVEVDFAGDSTGFMSSRFARWYDQKYGRMTKEHEWVKVHLMCGVKTNVVTAVEIKGKDANDSPLLPDLARTTARNFKLREVSLDKEYGSANNFDVIHQLGGIGYIAFKRNATGAAGGMYQKMYHTFCLNREEYMKHYHKRSNVESTVGMIKAKFGDSVRSKTDVAMTNEALCKVLCHNLCCLIQATYELGIEPEFWGREAEEQVVETAPALPQQSPDEVEELVAMLAWV